MAFVRRYRGPSFWSLLQQEHPELLPRLELPAGSVVKATDATTICAVTFREGVILGGDRRATMDGHVIMSDEVTKVFKVDEHSAIAIAGTFGPSVKMARLFQVELEHYEKIEGTSLTLDGKANRLSQLVEQNLMAAMQGLVVMPLYAGYDTDSGCGRIYEFDITGGTFVRHEAEPFAANGSGGDRARTTFEHFWREDLSRGDAVDLVRRALEFAARRDTATGGKSPILMVMTRQGVEVLGADEPGRPVE